MQRARPRLRRLGRVDLRAHHALDAEVQRARRAPAHVGLDAHEPVHARGGRAQQLAEQLRLVAAAVLEVDQQPIEPGQAERLRGQRRAERQKGAEQRLARGQAGLHGGLRRHRRLKLPARGSTTRPWCGSRSPCWRCSTSCSPPGPCGRRGVRALHAAASEYAALHDHVTELPNRVLFHDRVHQAIKLAARDVRAARRADDRPRPLQGDQRHARPPQRRPAAVHGRRAADGDAARRRLRRPPRRRRVRGADHRRRRPRRRDRGHAPACARRSPQRLELEELAVEVEASVGIALYPEHGEDPETLLQHADVAMYAAKQRALRPRPLRRRRRRLLAREPRADRRPAARDRRRGARPALPAQGRPAERPRDRRRGARALGAPRARLPLSRTRSSRWPRTPA